MKQGKCKCGKKIYPTKKEAETAMNYINKLPVDKEDRIKRVYQCPDDKKSWHLTSDKREKGNKKGRLLMASKFNKILQKQKTMLPEDVKQDISEHNEQVSHAHQSYVEPPEVPEDDCMKWWKGNIEKYYKTAEEMYKEAEKMKDNDQQIPVYESLEQILEDMKNVQWYPYDGVKLTPETIKEKLQATIDSQRYIQKGEI